MRDLTDEQKKLHEQALAEGYKDETCPRCRTEFLAFHHFIRCDNRPCPMLGDNPKSLLDTWADETNAEPSAAQSGDRHE